MNAGFASADITPRLGVQLAGYGPYRNRAARAVTSPLAARVVALSQGRERAVLVSLELCGTPRDLAWKIRGVVAARAGCRLDQVFLSCTHTHSGPSVGGMIGWGEPDAMYVETLPARIAAAVDAAVAARRPVEWRYAEVPCEGIAINRETDLGGWFGQRKESLAVRLDPAWRPARPQDTDPTLRLLAAYAGGKLVGVLHHFGCHAVVGSEQTFDVHGDFVGVASRLVEAAHPGATAIFLPGALGDINPPVCHRGERETHRALRVLSRKYAAVIRRGLRAARPMAADELRGRQRDVTFTRKPWTAALLRRRVTALEQTFAQSGVTDVTSVGRPPLHTHGLEMVRLEAYRSLLAGTRNGRVPNRPVSVHGLRIGPLALLGAGLEVFHSLQAPVLAGSPHPHTWLVSLSGGVGYAPDARACAQRGYTDDLVPLIVGERPYAKIYRELPRELVKLARELEG
ncbi:MAG TPA: neutral/alkaline non-lysosomal ceramidase N-terminal domain-containing protein [Opitutaceae bacterium]|nr:neutral/alkaline non-lysosomal ceramidase N-terminal domain-containing protein [Opitutaceae bacterium]